MFQIPLCVSVRNNTFLMHVLPLCRLLRMLTMLNSRVNIMDSQHVLRSWHGAWLL